MCSKIEPMVPLVFFLLFLSCANKVVSVQKPPFNSNSEIVQQYLQSHADYATQLWESTLSASVALEQNIQTFVQEPNAKNLESAKKSWLHARSLYSQTEALRFQNGPIDHPQTGVEGLLNAWPLDEAYVDYIAEDPGTGIVNQVTKYQEINKELLVSLNEQGGEENISTGYHAIEFLLWGQDQSTNGPGNRPLSDFQDHPNAQRRLHYLAISAQLVVEHLSTVHEAWKGSYRTQYAQMTPKQRLSGIWTGLAMLTGDEMAGERMAVAYETKDQEDEQSCFSDNTLEDFKNNLIGIQNQYNGNEQFLGLSSLLKQQEPELNASISKKLQEAVQAVHDIPYPFDQSLQSEADRPKIENAISHLEDLSDLLVEGAASMGVSVLIEGG